MTTRYQRAKEAVAAYTERPLVELRLKAELNDACPDEPIAVRSETLRADFLVLKPYAPDRVLEVGFSDWPPRRHLDGQREIRTRLIRGLSACGWAAGVKDDPLSSGFGRPFLEESDGGLLQAIDDSGQYLSLCSTFYGLLDPELPLIDGSQF